MQQFTKDEAIFHFETSQNVVTMIKLPHPVPMIRMTSDFAVETNEGWAIGKAGDFMAHDPISGHTWPVTAEYVECHYVKAE